MPDQAGHKKGDIHKLRHQFYHTLFVWSGVGSLWPSCAPHLWHTNRNEMRLRIRSKCQMRRGTKKGKARVIHNLRLFACLFDLGFRQFGCLACPHGGSHCNPRLPVIPGDPKCQIRRGTKKVIISFPFWFLLWYLSEPSNLRKIFFGVIFDSWHKKHIFEIKIYQNKIE